MEAPWMLKRRCRNPGGGFGRLMKGMLATVIPARIAMVIPARIATVIVAMSQSAKELLQR